MTSSKSQSDSPKQQSKPGSDDREARLAEKLRENLKRRKALSRGRNPAPDPSQSTAETDQEVTPDAESPRGSKED